MKYYWYLEKHFSAVSLWHQPTDMKLKQKVFSLVDLFFVIVVDICVIKWYKKSHKAIFKVSSVFTWCKPHFIINKFEKMEWKLYDCKKLTWIQISKNLHFCYGFFFPLTYHLSLTDKPFVLQVSSNVGENKISSV